MIRINIMKYLAMLMLVVAGCVVAGCESLDDTIGEDPYGGGKEPLGIKLLNVDPVPASAYPGDTVMFRAQGLLKWCDPKAGNYQFKMYLGGEEAKIVNATDSTMFVKVPQNLSSGITYIVLENQVFYGPTFTVIGNLTVDENYGLYTDQDQFTGIIRDYVQSRAQGKANNFYLAGELSHRMGNNSCLGLGLVNERGTLANSMTNGFRTEQCLTNSASSLVSSQYLNTIAAFDDGKMIVGGECEAYYTSVPNDYKDLTGGYQAVINNMTMITNEAQLDTVQLNFNETLNENGKYTPIPVARFNGGFTQPVLRLFVTKAANADKQQVIAVGNITQYVTTQYASSFSDNREAYTSVANVARLNRDGSLDLSYRNVSSGKYKGAAGGTVTDACQDEEGGVILVGSFTSFDGVKANGMVRLDKDGNVDRSFAQNLGTGFNGSVTKIRYNADVKKAAVVGSFTKANGYDTQSIALVGVNGTVDKAFRPRVFEGGRPTFASVVSQQSDKVIVAGSFSRYDGVYRRGFLVLDMDGKATQEFNVPGQFSGELYQVVETETTIGGYGLLLLGDITKFNGLDVNNAVMLEADFR